MRRSVMDWRPRLQATARRFLVFMVAILVATGLRVTDLNPAYAETVSLRAFAVDQDPGLDATTGVWRDVPSMEIPLSAQMVTFPIGGALEVQTPTVRLRALHDQDTLFIAVDWPDSTVDDSATTPEDFADGAAVELPAVPASTVPSVCMGQADQNVNIWHWRADNETGPPDQPSSGYVDQYPSTDALHYPARAAGNPYAQPDGGAVQNLVAGGFGTLTPVDEQAVRGHGVHGDDRWTVVFARDYASPGPFQPTFADGQVIDVAFAVWDGALEQRNGTKSVTSFVRLALTNETPPTASLVPVISLVTAAVVLGGVVLARRRRASSVTASPTDG